MTSYVFIGLLIWITIASALLVWFRDYKECAIGGAGLFVLIVVNAVTLKDIVYGTEYYNFLPSTLWMMGGFALVLTQHVFGHLKYWLREGRKTGQKLFY